MNKALLSFILILCCVNWIVAQDLNADLKQLLTKYEENAFQCEITTQTYQKHSSTQPDFSEKSLLKRKGSQLFYETEKLIILNNEQFSISYNKERAVIFCNQKTKPTNQQFSLFNFSKLLEQFSSVEYKGLVENDKCYILKRAGGPFSIMEFYFDQDQSQIRKIVYHYEEQWARDIVKTVVYIKHLPMDRPFRKDQFSERQFVQILSGKVRVQPNLKNHHLVLGEGLDYATAP